MTETQWMRTFGNNLRDILREVNMSQSELADEIGVSQATVSKYIRGQIMPSVRALVNICHVLDVDLYDILYFGERIT